MDGPSGFKWHFVQWLYSQFSFHLFYPFIATLLYYCSSVYHLPLSDCQVCKSIPNFPPGTSKVNLSLECSLQKSCLYLNLSVLKDITLILNNKINTVCLCREYHLPLRPSISSPSFYIWPSWLKELHNLSSLNTVSLLFPPFTPLHSSCTVMSGKFP